MLFIQSNRNFIGYRGMQTVNSWKKITVILALTASCSTLQLTRGRETEHFLVHGNIPESRIEIIYEIFKEKILIPNIPEEKIVVKIDPCLRSANLDGKTYADRISLASYSDNTFIHELAHYLWEIRGWGLRPWLTAERSRLRSSHRLIKEEFLNHYLIYDVIVPKVEDLLM